MAVDIYHKRRYHFNKCLYWLRDETNLTPLNEWVFNKKHNGVFYGKEDNNQQMTQNDIGNVAMFDRNSIVLSTNDDIDNIKRGCIVLYQKELWFVDDVQKIKHKKESEFSNKAHYTYYLSCRK